MWQFLKRLFFGTEEIRQIVVEQKHTRRPPEEIAKSIGELDLESVKKELVEKRGWTKAKTERIAKEYRQFLFLAAMYPETMVVPWSVALDHFWHQHIQDTPKYRDACAQVFRKYFDHDPHAARTNRKSYEQSKRETLKLRKEIFSKKASGNTRSSLPNYYNENDMGINPIFLWMILDTNLDIGENMAEDYGVENAAGETYDRSPVESDSVAESSPSDSAGESVGSSGDSGGGSSCGGGGDGGGSGCGGGGD